MDVLESIINKTKTSARNIYESVANPYVTGFLVGGGCGAIVTPAIKSGQTDDLLLALAAYTAYTVVVNNAVTFLGKKANFRQPDEMLGVDAVTQCYFVAGVGSFMAAFGAMYSL